MSNPITAYGDVINYAAKDTEHAHQTALMMWIRHAAWDTNIKNVNGSVSRTSFWHRHGQPFASSEGHACYVIFTAEQIEWLASPLLFAIPNGGARDRVTAARLRDEGVKTGVADLCLAVPRLHPLADGGSIGTHGLYIEMKRPKSQRGRQGRPSPAQEAFRDAVEAQGYAWELAVTWHEALECIWTYLNA